MILSNFIKAMSSGINSAETKTTTGSLKNYNISSSSIKTTYFGSYNNGPTESPNLTITIMGIALSSDTSVPTVDDYQFDNFYTPNDLHPIDNSLTPRSMQIIFTQTVRNDGAENVVINSVGVFGQYEYSNYESILLTKTLLDTPVTVAPGEVKTITVTIDYNSFVENVNA